MSWCCYQPLKRVQMSVWISFHYYGLGQGRDKALQYLRENPPLCDEIEKVWMLLPCIVSFCAIYIVLLVKRSRMLIMCLGPLIYLTWKVGINYYLKLPDPIFLPIMMGLFYEAWTLQIRRCIHVGHLDIDTRRTLLDTPPLFYYFLFYQTCWRHITDTCPSGHACLWRCPCP